MLCRHGLPGSRNGRRKKTAGSILQKNERASGNRIWSLSGKLRQEQVLWPAAESFEEYCQGIWEQGSLCAGAGQLGRGRILLSGMWSAGERYSAWSRRILYSGTLRNGSGWDLRPHARGMYSWFVRGARRQEHTDCGQDEGRRPACSQWSDSGTCADPVSECGAYGN